MTLVTAVGIVAILFLSFVVLFFGANALGFPLPTVHKGSPVRPMDTMMLFILQDLTYIPVAAFVFYMLPRIAKRSLVELGLGRPTLRDVTAGLFGVVMVWISVAAVSIAFDAVTHTAHHQQELKLFENLNAAQTVVCVVTAVFLAPLFEEIVFRLFLFNALLRYMPVTLAVILDGVLFGFAHGDLGVVPPLAVCGMGLAAIYYRTGSLWANVIAHACFNGITTVVVIFFHYKG